MTGTRPIVFEHGIPVTLGGTLELTFAEDVNLASQVGRTFDVFDWTGVDPFGTFAIASPYKWDLSHLYTTGQVTLTAIPEPGCALLAGIALGVAMLCRSRQRCRQVFSALVLVVCSSSAYAVDRVYTLVPDTPFDGSPYGFSGTITTDGSTGYFSDVSFIRDWSITVETPSLFDGVSTELFTSASPPLLRTFQHSGFFPCECLHVTESSISLVAVGSPRTNLNLGIGREGIFLYPTIISWNGPYSTSAAFVGSVNIGDRGESPSSETRNFGDLLSLQVATNGVAIPEPATLFLLLTALTALFPSRHRPHRSRRAMQTAASSTFLIAFTSLAQADLYQWEYINPAEPSQGKQQSATLAPDGAGIEAVPGADLSKRNLTMAYLVGATLNFQWNGRYITSNLADTNLSQADLTNARLDGATLTGAGFAGAEVRGASFHRVPPASPDCHWGRFCSPGLGTGITLAQLYSTASYAARDLGGIILNWNDLANADFAGQNLNRSAFYGATLTDGDFGGADLTGVNFSRANLANTRFTQFSCGDVLCIPNSATLTNVGFTDADLRNASFTAAWLTDVDFSNADVRGAQFR